jgi:hypothetical protein
MPLTIDEVTITLAVSPARQRVFTLRASLWAAFNLYQEHGSYAALATAIAAGSFSAYCSIIRNACTDRAEFGRFQASLMDDDALTAAILETRDDLLRFVRILAGADNAKAEPSAKPITFEEYHTRLFKIGTGWLGWTTDATWDATASEILTAYEGRLDLLKAVFGKSGDEPTEIDGRDPNARAALNALGDLSTTSMVRHAV